MVTINVIVINYTF